MMQVPQAFAIFRQRRFANPLGVAVALLLVCAPLLARSPQPVTRIPLDQLGFQPLAVRYLVAGSCMLTLHYVDDSHLLLTFNNRRLIKRIAGDPPEDQDRIVDALLLDLPSGHVLARTEWRLHDHGQYLWPLGHGHFLLRVRGTLTTIAPLVNLDRGDAFEQRPFLHTARQIVFLRVAPTSDMLTVETIEPPPSVTEKSSGASNSPADLSPAPRSREVQINFYRLTQPAPGRDYFVPRTAGAAFTRSPVDLPVNAAGTLHLLDEGHQRWAFDFKYFTGKVLELALYDSTCRPLPLLVSASEFIAFGCHGGAVRQQLAAFNLRGDEMWEQTLSGAYLSPTMVFAPNGGRFALGRLIVVSAVIESENLSPAEVTSESVDVYQIDSGSQLLHVECTPVARAGQNFTFSPDGLNLAVIRAEAIEIYRLPPLNAKDQTAIKHALESAPEPNEVPVDLASSDQKSKTSKNASKVPPDTEKPDTQKPDPAAAPTIAEPPPPPATAVAPAVQLSHDSPTPAGDPTPDQARPPPTLYNPGESKPQ